MNDSIIPSESIFDNFSASIKEIRELSSSIPRDGNIDVNIAEVLATKFLRGADLCSELLAISTRHVARMDSLKKKTYNYSFLVKSGQSSNIKTDKMRAAFAEIDEEYLDACEKYAQAIAFIKWINSKYDSFNKMHYMCKKILERSYAHEKGSYYNGRSEFDDEYENEKNPEW